jgi:cobyric acid synthase
VVGICGGFQLLGQQIRDPLGIESGVVRLAPAATPAGEDPRGLGLLGVNTVLAAEKTLRRTAACHAASGLEVTGYEIHHGQTDVGACVGEFRRSDGEILGAASPDGHVWGTYLHGVFDDDAFRRWFIDRLRVHRGLTPIGRVVGRYDIEPALERLAEAVRRALPVEQIYRMMGLR